MMFECIKRIFGRPAHDCLSSANKPKVVEVILKFAKLYDGVDLSNDQVLRTHFDDFVRLDFLQFGQRSNLHEETIKPATRILIEFTMPAALPRRFSPPYRPPILLS